MSILTLLTIPNSPVLWILGELEETVAQTAEELLIVVARSEDEAATVGEFVQGLEDAGLAGDAVDGARQLEQDRAVQTLVDGVEGNARRCNTKH